jgi:hypothetical protein
LSTLFVSSKTRAFCNREGVGRGSRVGEVVGRGMKWGNERTDEIRAGGSMDGAITVRALLLLSDLLLH